MFKRSRVSTAVMLAFGGTVALGPVLAHAQTVAQQQLERVEITGSAIRRIDAETAVPVTVIRLDDLKKQGVTTIEQVLQNVSAVQFQQGTSQAIGSGTGGAAFADIRGLGANKTLILLNGRRVANNAFDSSAVDINTIPIAALERIEVLRDGASALYGTDAIGGVINFITRRDFTGGVVAAQFDNPKKNGAQNYNGNVGVGFGDITKDNFNVFGFVDYQKQLPLGGLDRSFNTRQPGGLSPTPFPANYFQDGDSGNPAAGQNGGCEASGNLISDGGTGCYITTSRFVDYLPKTERYSGMLKGTLRINDAANLGLEYFGTRSEVQTRIAPVPYGNLYQNRVLANGSLNPFYPGNPGSSVPQPNISLDPNYTEPAATNPAGSAGPLAGLNPGFIHVKFRDIATGQRVTTDYNYQHRVIATLDGTFAGFDYQTGIFYNQNRVKDYISGYSDGGIITAGVRDGVINPFGDQSSTGADLIASAGLAGLLQTAKGTVAGADARFSKELGDWLGAGRAAALAVGVEGRHEKFTQQANTEFATRVIASTGIDPNTLNAGSRNVYAAFAELNVPLLTNLEVTGALRYDKYSDFGNSTNPKVSFRFEPMKEVLLRGSYSTGFRAPSLYELNSAQAYTNTSQFDDPIRCPNGTPIPGAPRATNCGQQFQALMGGNQDLKAEKSRNATVGVLLEPVRDLTLGVDGFWIFVKKQIGSISDVTIFGDPVTFAPYYHRLPNGSLSTDGSACPNPATCGYIDQRNQNLGNVKTAGLDLSANYRLRAGELGNFAFGTNTVYLLKYEYQDFLNGPYNQNINTYSGAGAIFKWQSNAVVSWTNDVFQAGVFGHYKSGYLDQDPTDKVPSYTTFDVYGGWSPVKQLLLTVGVRNVFDRDPPYSNQTAVFQANYDPRYSDPTGRTWYFRGQYTF